MATQVQERPKEESKQVEKLVTRTRSICPECYQVLPADVLEINGKIYIKKTCPKHGEFDELYFGDAEIYYRFARWLKDGKGTGNPDVETARSVCPYNCGLCSSHLSHTGLANLVVTNRCDLHCWYCLPADEELLVKDRKGVRLVKVGELVESFFREAVPVPAGEGEYVQASGLEVLTYRASEAVWTKVAKLYRRKYHGSLLEISTKSGRRIRVTSDHMVLVYNGSGLERKHAKELRKGDKLLVIRKLPVPSDAEFSEINLFKALNDLQPAEKRKIYVRGLASSIESELINQDLPKNKVYRWIYRDSIPLTTIPAGVQPGMAALGLDATDQEVPSILTLSAELMELVGYFIADGHYTYKDLRITSKDEFVISRLKDILARLDLRSSILNLEKHGKANQLVIGSRLMRTIFMHVLNIPPRASNKRLPAIAFSLPPSLKLALLSGLFNGDGYVVRGRRHCSLGIATVSRGLARDIALLLASIGIFCRIYRVPREKMKGAKHDLFKLYVSGRDLEKLVQALQLKPTHLRKLAGLGPRRESRLKTVGDFVVDEVDGLETLTIEGEYVYDLEVKEESHSFICGDGILVSNCFFYAEKAGYIYEPTIDQIREMALNLRAERPVPGNSIQITGGEPTLRDDLPEIVKILKEVGVDHIQLNTNGIRLSRDFEYFKKIKEAGVSNLYMSFDGVTPRTNPKNHWEVPGVLENARKLGVGIVLVPTVIKSVNDHELGDIIRFGFKNIDVVRAVNFQPVSLTGRMPKKEREKYRITIPDCIIKIEEQTNGQIPRDAWFPVPACTPLTNFIEALTRTPKYELSIHFACGAGTYIFKNGDRMIPITEFVDVEGLIKYLQDKAEEIETGRSRVWVGMKVLANISKYIKKEKQPEGMNLARMLFNIIVKHDYKTVGDWHRKSLFAGMMHFMDPYNHDEERLRRCDIHYLTPDNRIVPFCSFNVVPAWYRDRIQAVYGISIEEWERRTGRRLSDDFYKRKLPSKQSAVPMASTKTAGFGGLESVPIIQGGSRREDSCGCSH